MPKRNEKEEGDFHKSVISISDALSLKDTGAWLLAILPRGQVLHGKSSYQQTVFTSLTAGVQKGAINNQDLAIQTKVRAEGWQYLSISVFLMYVCQITS